MIQRSVLYFVTAKEIPDQVRNDDGQGRDDVAGGEFLKIQPGTGDNLSAEDVAAGFTDYVIWNRFKAMDLNIDGELEMECVDSGMVMIKEDFPPKQGDLLKNVLEYAYNERKNKIIKLY